MKRLFSFVCIFVFALTSCVSNVSNNTQLTYFEDGITVTDTIKDAEDTIDTMKGECEMVLEKCTLYVNGLEVENDKYTAINMTDNYVVLPLIKTMRSLGATIKCTDRGKANIIYRDNIYVLDALDNSLTEKNSNDITNYIALAPGATSGYYELKSDDYLVGLQSLLLFFERVDINVEIDYSALKVSISTINSR